MAANSPASFSPERSISGGGGEEGALEGVALHAELQFRVGCLLAGDLEAVEIEDADLALDHEAARGRREAHPHLLGALQTATG